GIVHRRRHERPAGPSGSRHRREVLPSLHGPQPLDAQAGLVRAFCENSGPTLEWLIGLAVEIPARESANAHMPGLAQAGVEDVWRGQRAQDQGYGLVQMLDKARRRPGVEVVLNTRVQSLLVEDGRVAGVVAATSRSARRQW
ncbi:FAD-binding protein, partial [Rhodococcus hoagii]|nr:FAD-binding protein [Prescottella equi]